jgi:hypothetical protein
MFGEVLQRPKRERVEDAVSWESVEAILLAVMLVGNAAVRREVEVQGVKEFGERRESR